MAQYPQAGVETLPEEVPHLTAVPPQPRVSAWTQPRDAADEYVALARRDLPALTSLRFFAAIYVVVHHLINIALLHAQGANADRAATWYMAWGTQGHVGVTFFFVLSGFILTWCYHRAFGTAASDSRRRSLTRTFWHARWARVWPLHAAMFAAFVPLAVLDAGVSPLALLRTAGEGVLNLFLLHAWIPFGGPDGLSDTFNAPSWTLSVEALFYLAFPLIATLVVVRLRWGIAQLALLAVGSWVALGTIGMLVAGSSHGDWIMRVLPATRLADFVIGIALGLIVVQRQQRAVLLDRPRPEHSHVGWTLLEAVTLAAACLSPLVWASIGERTLPNTLGASWFHLPAIAAAILVIAMERGAISRWLLALRPLVWLGEISYALYLVHLFLILAAYRIGAYDMFGTWITSLLLIAAAIGVSAVVHERFEKPVRARLVARRAS